MSTNEGNETDNGSNDNEENSQDCEAVQITTSSTQISVTNLTAPNSIVKVFNENYDLLFECVGNCGSEVIVTDLLDGKYHININFYDENWADLCEKITPITLGSNTSNSIGRNEPTIRNSSYYSASLKWHNGFTFH